MYNLVSYLGRYPVEKMTAKINLQRTVVIVYLFDSYFNELLIFTQSGMTSIHFVIQMSYSPIWFP